MPSTRRLLAVPTAAIETHSISGSRIMMSTADTKFIIDATVAVDCVAS